MMSFKSRYFVFILVMILLFIGIISRLAYLMIYQHEFYLDRSEQQIQKLIKIDTSRGKILDRNMRPLAMSQPVYSIYVSPKYIDRKLLDKYQSENNIIPDYHHHFKPQEE